MLLIIHLSLIPTTRVEKVGKNLEKLVKILKKLVKILNELLKDYVTPVVGIKLN